MEQNKRNDDEQLEEHSLPGTNMAGRGPGDECESPEEQKSGRDQGDDKIRGSNDQAREKP